MAPKFSDIAADRPSKETLASDYAKLNALLDEGDRPKALKDWEKQRREYDTWSNLVYLRYAQNTTDAQAKAEHEYADVLDPAATEHEVALKRRMLADPDRTGLQALVGKHAVRLWEVSVTTFEPAIAADMVEESKLKNRYTELLASGRVTIQGKTVNLSGIAPFAQSLDREVRHESQQARWGFFAEHGEELDEIFDKMVKQRHGMAVKLGVGDESYTSLAYRLMGRTDYDQADVARYREQVASEVVPLASRALEDLRKTAKWDHLYAWDEALTDPKGNPKPAGDHDLLLTRAETMFEGIDKRLADFYRHMRDDGFMDLKNREGKAGGGFCISFASVGEPYIFANFNGTFGDIDVFTHEMGHAFQKSRSGHQPMMEYFRPTPESAEVNSTGLEFLSHPRIGLLLEDGQADRYRRMHLLNWLVFLPYGVCVDHFQHEVYAKPEASPAERHEMWQTLEQKYMPWRDYGDLQHPAKGGFWQAQAHIYENPFYYIDYTLAACCALQYWAWSRNDYKGAVDSYVDLCGRGGAMPFQQLVRSAGLKSPFEPGALSDVVREAEAALGIPRKDFIARPGAPARQGPAPTS